MLLFTFLFFCSSSDKLKAKNSLRTKKIDKEAGSNQIAAKTFIFRDLAITTKIFRGDYLLEEGSFGRVYNG
uniref:Putative ovule protein n=1 Tax=Solanum chacoense TaxID=4108 RepID=A0A0V0H4W8_SOLCH